MVKELDYEEAFEVTGRGKLNSLALFTCGCVLLSVATECMGLGFVLSLAECDLNISMKHRGLLGASTLMGVVIPAIMWGFLADVYGRRLVMLPSVIGAFLTSLCSAFSVNFWNMLVTRFLTGFLLSASCATVYVYLGELHASSYRVRAISWASAFIALANICLPGMAWIMLPRKWSVHIHGSLSLVSWRAFMLSWGIWTTLAAVGLFLLPESPRYLLAARGPVAALPVLAKIYAWNKNMDPEDYPVSVRKDEDMDAYIAPTLKESIASIRQLVRRPLLRCVLISHYCNFVVFMQTAGISFWMPHMVNELLHNAEPRSMCTLVNYNYAGQSEYSDVKVYTNNIMKFTGYTDTSILSASRCAERTVNTLVYPIAMCGGVVLGLVYMTLGFFTEKLRKKTIFCAIMVTCSALAMASALVPHSRVAIVLLIPTVSAIAASSLLTAVTVEVFPTSLRALSMCTLFMFGRLGGALGAQIFGLAMVSNCTPIIITVTAVAGGSSLLIVLWPNSAEVRAEMELRGFMY